MVTYLRYIRTSRGAKDRAKMINLSWSEQAVQIGSSIAEHDQSDQSWEVSRAECINKSRGELEENIGEEGSKQVKKWGGTEWSKKIGYERSKKGGT